MEIGIDSFAAAISDPATGLTVSPVDRLHHLLEEIKLADQVGLDVAFGIGEHHRAEFLDSAPVVIFIRGRRRANKKYSPHQRGHRSQRRRPGTCLPGIRHTGLNLAWPRGNRRGPRLVRRSLSPVWFEPRGLRFALRGKTRSPAGHPREHARPLVRHAPHACLIPARRSTLARCRIRCLFGSGSVVRPHPSPARACLDSLSWSRSSVANRDRFRPLIELYREAGRRAGHPAEKLTVGLHSIGFLGDTTKQAADDFYPGYAYTFTKIGQERGWPPTTRAQFDAVRGTYGRTLIGDAETVAKKFCM